MKIFKGSPANVALAVKSIQAHKTPLISGEFYPGEACNIEIDPTPLWGDADPVTVRLSVPGEADGVAITASGLPDGRAELTWRVEGLPCPGDLPEEMKERILRAWEKRRAARPAWLAVGCAQGLQAAWFMNPPRFTISNPAARSWRLILAELERLLEAPPGAKQSAKGGRPVEEIDDWAAEEVLTKGREMRDVFPEWKKADVNKERVKRLKYPYDAFKRVVYRRKGKYHSHTFPSSCSTPNHSTLP